ncbi:MAG: HEAT repeat domain-containing protein [Planctomycetaceae bacterium]|nr:HEAT repeat domain-containing protein [Planctomycetaceae bacterium]
MASLLLVSSANAATLDELLAKVRDSKAEPSVSEIAATELAKQFPQSHTQFLELFRNARMMRIKRVLLKQMIAHKMPALDTAMSLALADEETLLRLTAAEGLASIAESPMFFERMTKALDDADVEVRWVAAKTLASSAAALEKYPDRARQLAVKPDPLMRQALLAHLTSAPAVQPLVAELQVQALLDADATTCISAAARAAGTLFSPQAKPTALQSQVVASLIARLADLDPVKAGAAGCALSLIMNPVVEAELRMTLTSPDLMQRARAAEVLRKRKLDFDPTLLAEVMLRGTEEQQLYACGTLSRMQSPGCVPLARTALNSASPVVRQSAVYALEVIADDSALKALIGALKHSDANVRYRAAVVLGRRPASGTAIPSLQNVAANDENANVREAARIAAVCATGGDVSNALTDLGSLQAEAMQTSPRQFDIAAGKPMIIAEGIVQVGLQKQLFVDDLIIDELGGAQRQLHRFRKDSRNPVLEQQFPWEVMGVVSYCTTVRYDPATRLFSFWTTSFGRLAEKAEAIASRAQCLALSTDGIEWKRVALGHEGFEPTRDTNRVGRAPNIVHYPAEKDAARRFASYAFVPERNGLAVSFSPDGIGSWTDWKFVTGGGNDVVTVCRDDLNPGTFSFMKWRVGRWFRRAAWPAWGATPESIRRGLINVTANFADDRLAMNRVAAVFPALDFFQPEIVRTEIYEVTPFIYEGIYFGLPVRFDISGRGGRNVDGPTDLALMFSRDKNGKGGWLRPGSPNYLATVNDDELERAERGTTPLTGVLDFGRWGEWDAAQLYGPSSLLVVDDQIVLYYTGGSFGHEPEGSRSDGAGKNVYRMAIGRATLRLDGMVSLRADKQAANITTKPMRFDGRELVINADCSHGSLRVDLLDSAGKTVATSESITSDSIRHVVKWPAGFDLATYSGKPVRLRLQLTNADLYAIQFQGGR